MSVSDVHQYLGQDELFALLSGDPVLVAPQLLGATLVRRDERGEVALRLTELEAYRGEAGSSLPDPGAHSFRGRTPRNSAMYGPPGHLYVYFSYGIHHCANLVCRPESQPGGILMRGAEVVRGQELAGQRRPTARKPSDLARGPALLANCLGLTTAESGTALLLPEWELRVPYAAAGLRRAAQAHAERTPSTQAWPAKGQALIGAKVQTPGPGQKHPESLVMAGPRVGVSGEAGTGRYPWRFWIAGDPSVSSYKPGRRTSARA